MLPCIIGWSHSKFGRLSDQSLEDLIGQAAREAIADAGLEPEEISEVYVGTFNPGLVAQDFVSSLVLNALPSLRFKPATRVENACATGSAAIFQACNAVVAGAAKFALVIGAEKMTELDSAAVSHALLKASYVMETEGLAGGFAGVFGQIATEYFRKYGDQSDALASIAAKNHKNAVSNPKAHMRQDLGFDFCRIQSERNPYVAAPLKRTDCALITDGAAALVLTSVDIALGMTKAVSIRGMAQTSDYLPLSRREDITNFRGANRAWQAAQKMAGVSNANLDFIELHDCFTISELIQYEALGITGAGQGGTAILDGITTMQGSLPVNPSGGLKARGHPVGATGVSMHVNAAMQLVGEAGDMQIKDAALAGIFNMGGVAVANYATILAPLRCSR